MTIHPDDDISALEKARERLYEPGATAPTAEPLPSPDERSLPHAWESPPFLRRGKKHVRLATIFLVVSLVFFVASLGAAAFFFYHGGNLVSVDKVEITLQGPTSIAGGDTVPLSLTITNKNPVALEDTTVEVSFPPGTLSADGTSAAYPRYTESLGTIESGATVTRSIKAIIFGGEGQSLILPVSFSYGTAGSNTSFAKKASYALAVSSTPLSISVETSPETVSGKPLTFNLTVRSNATEPIENVVVTNTFPFGFTTTDSSVPLTSSGFSLGTLKPGASKKLTLTGILIGQDGEKRSFRFSVGTAKSASDPTLAVSYMTQDAPVTIVAPFITTTLSLNGDANPDPVLAPGSRQSAMVSYVNTLQTSVANAVVSIALSGSAIDYNSVQTTSGFYNSTDRTIIFSKDTDASLALMSPGASGIGSFTFSTLPAKANIVAPTITFSISVAGTRAGQTNVAESINASMTKTVKVAATVAFTASSAYSSGTLSNTGPIPPRVGAATTYTVEWGAQNRGSTIADGVVQATLPSYVSYTGKTSGTGSFFYDETSRTVRWNMGDLSQGASAQGAFQVSLIPSVSQKGSAPVLTGPATFSGHDRFAGVKIQTTADPVTTETKKDPGYSPLNATVQ
jgi:hypothetical protein